MIITSSCLYKSRIISDIWKVELFPPSAVRLHGIFRQETHYDGIGWSCICVCIMFIKKKDVSLILIQLKFGWVLHRCSRQTVISSVCMHAQPAYLPDPLTSCLTNLPQNKNLHPKLTTAWYSHHSASVYRSATQRSDIHNFRKFTDLVLDTVGHR